MEYRPWASAAVASDGGMLKGEVGMSRWLAAVAARATRVVRGLWPGRNPLRRAVDRVEGVMVGALAVAFLAGAPLATVAAYGYGAHTARVQQAAWHQVPAVLLAAAPATGYTGYQPEVRARWRAPGGARRTGTVPVPPGTRAGSTVRVWTDAAGRPADPALQLLQVKGRAALAATLAPALLGGVLLAAGLLGRHLLGRRRLAAWEAQWRAIGPRWSRR
jgi:hypothetical protein